MYCRDNENNAMGGVNSRARVYRVAGELALDQWFPGCSLSKYKVLSVDSRTDLVREHWIVKDGRGVARNPLHPVLVIRLADSSLVEVPCLLFPYLAPGLPNNKYNTILADGDCMIEDFLES